MAVFWKHIKGTGNAETNNDGLWSWIEWATPANFSEASEVTNDTRTMAWSPKIKCNLGNTGMPVADLGHIITSDNLNQVINEQIRLVKVVIDDVLVAENSINFHAGDSSRTPFRIIGSGQDQIKLYLEGVFEHKGDLNHNGVIANIGNINNTGDIINSGKCEAQYFNALSDKRAKENIYPLMSSALDIINAVQVYTFNYKNSDKTTIGLIAQEVLPYNLDGATFVSNPDATGEDGDYMSITESKLVYLLLKGMQEQQEQINQLKQRITDLEGK